MSNVKKLKKGEILIKEGDIPESLYLVKSGRFSIYIERNNSKIEIAQVNTGQLIGERILFQAQKLPFTVMAQTEATCLEVPAKLGKDLYEKADAFTKVLMKGMSDSLLDTRKNLQSMKMETSSLPCPQKFVARAFGAVVMITHQGGMKDKTSDKWVVPWSALKLYAVRFFLEAPQRMQGVCEILMKLGYVNMVYKIIEDDTFDTGEEPEEELAEIELLNIQFIQDFAEWFQFNFYKPGRNETLFVDKMVMRIAEIIADLGEGCFVDHKKATHVDYNSVVQTVKAKMGLDFKPSHMDLLEKKGLFGVRKTKDDAVFLVFDREEFSVTAKYWKVLYELDKWNDNGFVNMAKEEEYKAPPPGASSCPSCSGVITAEAKFCPNCGSKVNAAA